MIREPVVAGQFYSRDPRTLRRMIDSYLEESTSPLTAMAVVSPHAGYVYSGGVAGAVFSAVRLPKRFILIGPNHTGRGYSLALAPEGEWETPLGLVPVDEEMNSSLLSKCPFLHLDPKAHAREHSLEVQIPFLQSLAAELRFSAVCVAAADYPSLESLGHAVAHAVRSVADPVLIVASSDMNHYEPAEIGRRKDGFAIERMVALDPRGLFDVVRERDISMCGFAPAVATLTACVDLGAREGKLIRYANSGDVSGEYDSVVGYAGLAFV